MASKLRLHRDAADEAPPRTYPFPVEAARAINGGRHGADGPDLLDQIEQTLDRMQDRLDDFCDQLDRASAGPFPFPASNDDGPPFAA